MELSLDDIIKRKKQKQNRVRKGGGGAPKPQINKMQQSKGVPKIKDARNHIILKKRTQITDARDKLAEIAKKGDARQKLEQLRLKRNFKGGNINRLQTGNLLKNKNKNGSLSLRTKGRINRGIFTDSTRQVHPSPLILSPYISRNSRTPISNYSLDVSMDEEYVPAPLKPIVRSISNDISDYLPPMPAFSPLSRMRSQSSLSETPFISDIRSGLNFKIVAKNDDVRISPISSSGIMNRNHGMEHDVYLRDTSPTNPVSILKKRQFGGKMVSSFRSRYDPTATPMTPRLSARQKISRPPSPPQSAGFRIVVSNLRNSVTASDIHELFGDVGKLEESRLVRPGTAEVIYASLKDAQKAVDVYHNRQLDGQPMKCFLVNPRNPPPGASNEMSKFGSAKPNLPASSNSSVIPDISTFHKVLFRKH